MLRPAYTVQVAGTALDALIALTVVRAQNGGAGLATLRLGGGAAAEGDPVTVELGWDGSTTLVFTGAVAAVEHRIDGLDVTCAGGQAKLALARGGQTFVQQTAGAVVSALASDAGVDVGSVEDGIDLPLYVADAGRTHAAHCLRLARWCGFDVYEDESGALAFGPFTRTSADHTYRYGADVLAAELELGAAGAATTVVPESPASSQGDETAAWLVKDPSPHAGGDGPLTVSEPALRTKEAADAAAQAAGARAARAAAVARVQISGAPDVALGDAVALADMPDAAFNRTFQVLGLRHAVDRRRGFRTQLALGAAP